MKWPTRLTIVRHAQSAYNILRERKEKDPDYQRFKRAYEDGYMREARKLARVISERYALGVSDYETPITDQGRMSAYATGTWLMNRLSPRPDVVFVSPYVRTRQTFEMVASPNNWLWGVPVIYDDRIREQEHGLSLLYNDWRVFHVMHPEQKRLRELMGPYWYQYPQGESVSQVRDRVRSFMNTLIREYSGQSVLMVTHHLTILSIRSLLERLTPEQFIELDQNNKPINCGVTTYIGNPTIGKSGKLVLTTYNARENS